MYTPSLGYPLQRAYKSGIYRYTWLIGVEQLGEMKMEKE